MKKYALFGLLSFTLYAHPGTILRQIDTETGTKTISLLKLNPSVIFNTKSDPEIDYSKGIVDFDKSPGAVYLVPSVAVLDQGNHGTCVTFATIAAMDAVLGLGDEIDEQCFLELSVALNASAWDGLWKSSEVIDPLVKYGAVRHGNCGSHHYPDPSAKISLDAYKALVDPSILVAKVQYSYKEPMKIEEVKAALSAHHYVSIGFGLLNDGSAISAQGFDVEVDGSKKKGGLWACKQPSDAKNYCKKMQAGHEVLIVGYDDSQRLLKIQNSWNISSGNAGFYYMSYEFFAAMEINASEIWSN
jgi:hypothetical protein